MSDLGNRQILSLNLQRYIAMKGKTRREVAADTGIKYSTLCDWINCNKYPRIDNIERLAQYFGIEKSALIEKEPAAPKDDELTKDEQHLIDIYRQLDDEGRRLGVKMMKTLLSEHAQKNSAAGTDEIIA